MKESSRLGSRLTTGGRAEASLSRSQGRAGSIVVFAEAPGRKAICWVCGEWLFQAAFRPIVLLNPRSLILNKALCGWLVVKCVCARRTCWVGCVGGS
jgi:hypothetical protein